MTGSLASSPAAATKRDCASPPVRRSERGRTAPDTASDSQRDRPDFSAAMLRLFLRARMVARRRMHDETAAQARRSVSRIVRRDAKITHAEFDMAIAGRLLNPAIRARIWGALGVVPADHGVELTQGGQRSFEPSPAAPPSAGGLPRTGADAPSRLEAGSIQKADWPSGPVAGSAPGEADAARDSGESP